MNHRRPLALACLIFFTIGWIAAMIGPALINLSRQTAAPLAALGSLISALFAGALIAQLVGGPLHDRLGVRPLLLTGLCSTGIGVTGILLSHTLGLTVVCGIIAGLGHGLLDIGISLFVALAFGTESVAALNFTNIFFGLGAFAAPAVAAFFLQRSGTALPVFSVSLVLAALALLFVILLTFPPTTREQGAPENHQQHPHVRWWASPVLWLTGGLFLLYVGLENGFGGWTTELVHRATGSSIAFGALIASFFWLALTAGRVAATAIGRTVTAGRLLSLAMLGTGVGTLLLFASLMYTPILNVAILLLGFCFGPIYPTAVVVTTRRFPESPGRATSLVTSLGSLGGVIIPWAQGALLVDGSVLTSVIFGIGLLIGLCVLIWRLAR